MDLAVDFSNRKPDKASKQKPLTKSTVVPPKRAAASPASRTPAPKTPDIPAAPKPEPTVARRPRIKVPHPHDPSPIIDAIVRPFPASLYAWFHQWCARENRTQAEMIMNLVARERTIEQLANRKSKP
jgi:hypothetical protein